MFWGWNLPVKYFVTNRKSNANPITHFYAAEDCIFSKKVPHHIVPECIWNPQMHTELVNKRVHHKSRSAYSSQEYHTNYSAIRIQTRNKFPYKLKKLLHAVVPSGQEWNLYAYAVENSLAIYVKSRDMLQRCGKISLITLDFQDIVAARLKRIPVNGIPLCVRWEE